jgi:O-antigen/teichoic acid export membrane protein
MPLLVALNQYLGFQWMLPRGLDRFLNTSTWFAGAVNITLAFALAPSFQQVGAAWAVVVAEAGALALSCLILRANKLNPWKVSQEPAPGAPESPLSGAAAVLADETPLAR